MRERPETSDGQSTGPGDREGWRAAADRGLCRRQHPSGCRPALAALAGGRRAASPAPSQGARALLGLVACAAYRKVARPGGAKHLRTRPEDEVLLSWLAALGAKGLKGVRVADCPDKSRGRGAFAGRGFKAGEAICEIPRSALLLPAPGSGSSEAPQVALARALLKELRAGAKSPFAPYLAALPPPGELAPEHPLLWPPGQEELFAGSVLARRLVYAAQRNGDERVKALLETGASEEEADKNSRSDVWFC